MKILNEIRFDNLRGDLFGGVIPPRKRD